MILGTVLDNKYYIDKFLSLGDLGDVYQATQLENQRSVTVKYIHPVFAGSKQVVALFQWEAQLASSIGHYHICEVIDTGITPQGAPYLVMPRLFGVTLQLLFKTQNIIDPADLVVIIKQLLSALGSAHEANIIHGSITPESIFLGAGENFFESVRLMDFGMSRILEQDMVTHQVEHSKRIREPHYLAPEQVEKGAIVDHRADLYAVGAILYRGLTGRPPFKANSYEETISKILTVSFPSPKDRNPNVHTLLDCIVLKATARNLVERYQTATEIFTDLEQYILETKDKSKLSHAM